MHKIAFQIGSFTIHWYGVLVAIGFMAGLWTASRRCVRYGIPPERIIDAGVWIIIGGVIGARGLFVLSYWDTLIQTPTYPSAPWLEIFMIRNGGLVFYGGLVGASLATILYTRWSKLPLWRLADALAPSIALGYVPGRLGCLMNGCCYGKPTDLPWGIFFPAGHEAHHQAVHPTQIYDSLLNLALYAGLAWLYRRKKFDGQIFASYLLCYAVARSVVEAFRGDYPQRYLGGIATPAHLISIAILVIGAVLYWKLAGRSKPA